MKPNRSHSRTRSAPSSTSAGHADDDEVVDAGGSGPLPATSRAFIDAYVIGLDAKAAAIRAGIPAKKALQQAGDLLREPAVAAAIRTRLHELRKTLGITKDEAMLRLSEASRDAATPLAQRIRIWSFVVDRAARTGDGEDGGTLLDWLLALPKPGAPVEEDAPGKDRDDAAVDVDENVLGDDGDGLR